MLERLFEYANELPAWLQPTYRGAIFILRMAFGWEGKLFVAALLATVMLLAGAERGLVLFGQLAGVSVLAGAMAGTLHGVLRPVERAGPLGTWLAWTVVLFGYVVSFVFFTRNGPFSWRDPTFYPLAAGFAALGGLVMVLLDDRSVDRPSPRQFQLLQTRKQLWTTARYKRARLQREMPVGP